MATYEFYSISWYKFLLCQIKCSGGVDDLYTAAGKGRELKKRKEVLRLLARREKNKYPLSLMNPCDLIVL